MISDYGLSDYYKAYKAKRNSDISYSQYRSVIDTIFKKIANTMSTRMYDLKLPYGLGRIIVRKYVPTPKLDDGGNITIKRAINWVETNKLWEEYPELRKKQFVYHTNDHSNGYIFAVIHKKMGCNFKNKSYYTTQINRQIKRAIAKGVKDGTFDTLDNSIKSQ